eukprot:TRINITY_DN5851_c0_g1_i10.p1 TRINITY_DN5851_c0_g1~~TRINITY_DN5851_c0_g1_i10.p1  ORF type:complete len:395 (+),score=69.34 TRINITY_DN5851_c0_g1_i10:223-1407(+)
MKLESVPNWEDDDVPCREEEGDNLYTELLDCLTSRSSRSIYIHGMPGCGKSLTMSAVLKKLSTNPDLGRWEYFEINAMQLAKSSDIYLTFLELLQQRNIRIKVDGNRTKPIVAQNSLRNYFARDQSKSPMILLHIEELDKLAKSVELLYDLFDWTTGGKANLIIVGISNDLSLVEKLFPKKVASRLGLKRINFVPYSGAEIEQILRSRLSDTAHIFENSALTLISKKVAASLSDVRRALHVSRKSLSLVEKLNLENNEEGNIRVNTSHVNQAHNVMYAMTEYKMLPFLSIYELLFILSVIEEIRIIGNNIVQFYNVVLRFKKLQSCHAPYHENVSVSHLRSMMIRLQNMTYIEILHRGRIPVLECDLRLEVDAEGVIHTLKDNQIITAIYGQQD